MEEVVGGKLERKGNVYWLSWGKRRCYGFNVNEKINPKLLKYPHCTKDKAKSLESSLEMLNIV